MGNNNGKAVALTTHYSHADNVSDSSLSACSAGGCSRITVTRPDGGQSQQLFDPLGRLVRSVSPRGETQQYEYDTLGRLVASVSGVSALPSGDSVLTGYSEALWLRTEYSYDAAGRLLSRISGQDADASGSLSTDEIQLQSQQGYNSLGQLSWRLTGDSTTGTREVYRYDAAGRVTDQWTLTGGTGSSTSGADLHVHTDYDGLGRVVKVTTAPGTAAEQAVTYSYNGADLVGVDGPRTDVSDTLSYSYTPAGRLQQVLDAQGDAFTYSYDALGRMVSLTQPGRDPITYSYDGRGRRTGEDVGNGRSASWSYWPDGRLHEHTDLGGKTTRLRYNSAGQLVHRDHAPLGATPGGADVTYSYNANGQLWQARDYQVASAGVSTDYYYDAAGRLVRHDRQGLGHVHYDYQGQLPSAIVSALDGGTPSSRLLGMDTAGRITSMRLDSWDLGSENFEFTYTGLGLDKTRYPDSLGVDADRVRDATGKVTTIENTQTSWSYHQQLSYLGQQVAGIEEAGTQAVVGGNRSFTLDAKGRMTQANVAGQVFNYAYNPDNSLDSFPGLGSLSYDSSGWLNDLDFNHQNAGTLDTYPAPGGSSMSASYDAADRLVATDDGVTQTTYAYDSSGMLVQTCSGPSGGSLSCTERLLDLASDFPQALATRGAEGERDYLFGPQRAVLASDSDAGGSAFYLSDHQNSVIARLDSTGGWTGSRSYTPYGALASDSIGAQMPYGYTGEWQNPDRTLYLRARHYAPHLGRFLQRDPYEGRAEEPASLNRFGYVHGAPMTHRDPSGNNPFPFGGSIKNFVGNKPFPIGGSVDDTLQNIGSIGAVSSGSASNVLVPVAYTKAVEPMNSGTRPRDRFGATSARRNAAFKIPVRQLSAQSHTLGQSSAFSVYNPETGVRWTGNRNPSAGAFANFGSNWTGKGAHVGFIGKMPGVQKRVPVLGDQANGIHMTSSTSGGFLEARTAMSFKQQSAGFAVGSPEHVRGLELQLTSPDRSRVNAGVAIRLGWTMGIDWRVGGGRDEFEVHLAFVSAYVSSSKVDCKTFKEDWQPPGPARGLAGAPGIIGALNEGNREMFDAMRAMGM